MSITIKTDYPVALDSPDHLYPHGTKRDNSTSIEFIEEVIEYFQNPKKLKVLDLGCSGGQLIKDFLDLGHFAVGLEGSDYSIKHERANWPELHNKNLFTCDCSRDYKVCNNNRRVYFDLITAWEVVEHIHPDQLNTFFMNIISHLKPGGIFVGSISTKSEIKEGYILHQSVFPEATWKDEIFPTYSFAELIDYPFKAAVRDDTKSFHIGLKRSC